ERERRTGDEFDQRDIENPITAGTKARALEPGREQSRIEDARAGVREPAEEAAHTVRQQRHAAPDPQQRLDPRRQPGKRAHHCYCDKASPPLMQAMTPYASTSFPRKRESSGTPRRCSGPPLSRG